MHAECTRLPQMDWMLPGLAPTGRRVRVPFVAVVKFEGEKVGAWDLRLMFLLALPGPWTAGASLQQKLAALVLSEAALLS